MIRSLAFAFLISSIGFTYSTSATAFPDSTSYNTENAPGTIVWYENTHAQGKIKFMTNGDYVVGVMSEIPHYPQPTDYTCGAANLAMAKAWFQFVRTGRKPGKPDIMAIYNVADTNSSRGLTTNELKNAIGPIVDLPHREYGWDTIDQALKQYVRETHLVDTYQTAPGIVYGNVPYGDAGGHYYSMAGAVHCSGYCNSDYNGAYFMDSVHNSPAYESTQEPKRSDFPDDWSGYTDYWFEWAEWSTNNFPSMHSITPGHFMTTEALEDYWKPTGASLPWNRKHYYVALTSFQR